MIAPADRFPLLKSIIIALLPLAASPAAAQQEDEQVWLQLNTNVPLARDLRLTLEQIARTSDRQGGFYTTELGALLGYEIADGVELGFGYRRVDAHNGNPAAGENRLRQQVVVSSGPIAARLRVDERFSEAGSGIGFRVRPLLRYNHRLNPGGVALFVSHESFFLPNSTRWGQRSGYERMRNIVGTTLPIGRNLSADIGYLNQYRLPRGGARAQMDHALTVQLTINLASGPANATHD
jgi:hypothetical protein